MAAELGLPIMAREVLLMARRRRRDGVLLPNWPGQARERLALVPCLDGDYRDRHGRAAYPVGPGIAIEGPWVCTRCWSPMCGGFMMLPANPDGHWPVCGRCVHVAE